MGRQTQTDDEASEAQTDDDLDTLAKLAGQSPVIGHSDEMQLRRTLNMPGRDRLEIDETIFNLGLCIDETRHSRAKHERTYRTGPYNVRVFRDAGAKRGIRYRVEVERAD